MSFSCGSFSPISFHTDCPEVISVKLDEFELYRIIEWEDVVIQTIPRKRIVGKPRATLDSSCITKQPTMINITIRMSLADKNEIWSLYGLHRWMCLSQNYVPVAYVWIENVKERNDCATDKNRPWLIIISLLCQNI